MQVDPKSQQPENIHSVPEGFEDSVPSAFETAPQPVPARQQAQGKSNLPLKIALGIAGILIVALGVAVFFLISNNSNTTSGTSADVKTELKEALGKTVAETKKIADDQGYTITLVDYDTNRDRTSQILDSDVKSKYYRVVKDNNGIRNYSEDKKTITYVVVAPLSESWDKWFTDNDFNNSGSVANAAPSSSENDSANQNQQQLSEESKEVANTEPTEEQKRALSRAEDYLKAKTMSRANLISTLRNENFSEVDAQYAADHCSANWEEQATKAAKEILELPEGSSYTKLLELLEGNSMRSLNSAWRGASQFTHDEAVRAIENNHPDWNEQAGKSAISKMRSITPEEQLTEKLVADGFTYDEATAGVEIAKKYKAEHPNEIFW